MQFSAIKLDKNVACITVNIVVSGGQETDLTPCIDLDINTTLVCVDVGVARGRKADVN
jgi:hypothetical protein